MTIESTQVYTGGIGPEEAQRLTGDGESRSPGGRPVGGTAFELEFQREVKLTFECACGRRFLKARTAREHLETVPEPTPEGDT